MSVLQVESLLILHELQMGSYTLGYAFLRSVSLALRDELEVTVTQELSR